MMTKPASNRISLDTLAKLCKVDTYDSFSEGLDTSSTYSVVYKGAIEEGKSEDEAEEFALKIESEEMGEACDKYHAAIVAACEEVFDQHSLILEPVVSRKYPNALPFEFRIKPKTTWNEALTLIRETINGHGMFEFRSNAEMCSSIPANTRTTVLGHIHWMFQRWDVYGDYSPAYRIDRRMRY
jgi:hypothetical protein